MSDSINKKLRQTEFYNQHPFWDELYDKSIKDGSLKQFSLGITPFTREGKVKIHDTLSGEIKEGINTMC